LSINRSQKATK